MKNWFKRNLKNIIVTAFVIPILLVAFVSISHVTSFYGISNPLSWALYLSVGIEIAALSALAAVSVKMGRFIYIPFLIVTLIQMIGNVFFSFSYIDESSEVFGDWISMVGGMFENMGIEPTNIPAHKLILSFLTGGLLPIISLTFAHMLVKYSEQNDVNTSPEEINVEDYEKITSEYIEKKKKQDDELRYKPTEEDIKKFESYLSNFNYEDKETVSNVEPQEVTPSEDELRKIKNFISDYPAFDKQEIKKYQELVIDNVEPEKEVVEEISNKTEIESVTSSENIVENQEVQEVKPEPITTDGKYKVLNYFKQ